MAQEWSYSNDKTGSDERAKGSDNRGNVSSRSDSRSYYNSRDQGLTFSVVFDFQSAAAGEYGAYWKNDSTSKELVIDSIGVNSVEATRIKLWRVTGTAAGGTTVTPTNLNFTKSHLAEATAMEGASAATGITGLTTVSIIDFVYVTATGHEEFRLDDRLRLGQGDAIALEYDEGTDGDVSGVIFGFYE